jgi:hypothetical protein
MITCEYAYWQPGPDGGYIFTQSYWSGDAADANSPANGYSLTYAHYADRLAYWIPGEPGRLWVSDLAYQHPQVVYTDTAGAWPQLSNGDDRLTLWWSADDEHLIVDIVQDMQGAPALIYHVATGTTEPWPWFCDRVAVSPLTGRLATWCQSVTHPSEFMVMEWHAPTWPSAAPATETVLVRGSRLPARHFIPLPQQTWAWSPDGQRLAFVDPQAAASNLHIVDAAGADLVVPFDALSDHVQWSQDGTRLLVLALGLAQDNCPLDAKNMDGFGPAEALAACWQVLDAHTGAVVWTALASDAAIAAAAGMDLSHSFLGSAALSPDGRQVALDLVSGSDHRGVIVYLDTGQVERIEANEARWGPRPDRTP